MTNTPKLNIPLIAAADPMSAVPPAWKNQFQIIDGFVGLTECTSSTRPASPFNGQIIYETNTNRHLVWDNIQSRWNYIDSSGKGLMASASGQASYAVGTESFILTKSFPCEFSRIYRVHVEGYIDSSLGNSSTITNELRLRLNLNGTTVSTADSLLSGIFCDSDRQINPFAFDGIATMTNDSVNCAAALSIISSGLGATPTMTVVVSGMEISDLGTGILP